MYLALNMNMILLFLLVWKFVLGSPCLEKESRGGTARQWASLYCEFFYFMHWKDYISEVIWICVKCNMVLIFPLLFQIVRPGGMERPTDSYKETHNILLSEEDTLFGGQVSNLQVFTNLYLQLEFLQAYTSLV